MVAWAQEHPDSPDAKAFLAEEASFSATSLLCPEEGLPPRQALRARQREADEAALRAEARRTAAEVSETRLLEWALAHPETPEGQRHLLEMLSEYGERIDRAEHTIRFAGYSAARGGEPEAIEAATRAVEAEAHRDMLVRTTDRIREVLTGLPRQ